MLFLEEYLPFIAVSIFGFVIIWVKKVNPQGGRKTTYVSTKDVFRKEFCPSCGSKMKKTWEETPMDKMGLEKIRAKEFEGTPIFTCKKCGITKKG